MELIFCLNQMGILEGDSTAILIRDKKKNRDILATRSLLEARNDKLLHRFVKEVHDRIYILE